MADPILLLGDCLEVMQTLEANSIDAIVTDPPYGLGFMGKEWDHGVPGEHFWREALRVAKPGAHLLAFGGSRTYYRLACAIEDAGWEIRDCLMWVYASGFPKSLDVSKAIDKAVGAERATVKTPMGPTGNKYAQGLGDTRPWMDKAALAGFHEHAGDEPATEAAAQWQGYGTALKPAYEPIILARKPLQGSVAANVLKHGTGALGIDACRIAIHSETTSRREGKSPKSNGITMGTHWHGCGVSGGNSLGRFPSNLLHDGSDEVLALFPETVKCRSRIGGQGSVGYLGGAKWIEHYRSGYDEPARSAARFFYCAKATQEDRDAGLEYERLASAGEMTGGRAEGSAGLDNPRAGAGRTAGGKNFHPTVKPTDLMRWCVRLIAPPGATVLDPFMGSGSTGRAALLEGRAFTGIELNPAYLALARRRIEAAQRQPDLFIHHAPEPPMPAPQQASLFDDDGTCKPALLEQSA